MNHALFKYERFGWFTEGMVVKTVEGLPKEVPVDLVDHYTPAHSLADTEVKFLEDIKKFTKFVESELNISANQAEKIVASYLIWHSKLCYGLNMKVDFYRNIQSSLLLYVDYASGFEQLSNETINKIREKIKSSIQASLADNLYLTNFRFFKQGAYVNELQFLDNRINEIEVINNEPMLRIIEQTRQDVYNADKYLLFQSLQRQEVEL